MKKAGRRAFLARGLAAMGAAVLAIRTGGWARRPRNEKQSAAGTRTRRLEPARHAVRRRNR